MHKFVKYRRSGAKDDAPKRHGRGTIQKEAS